MKIKTIAFKQTEEGRQLFDKEVNKALEEGWHLEKRERTDGYNLGSAYFAPCFYAELVKTDEPDEPHTLDPFEALRIVQDYCDSVPVGGCSTGKCVLFHWCEQLRNGGDPTDWLLPRREDGAT